MNLVMSALEKIPSKHLKGSVVHTDRESQYTSKEMREKLKKLGALESFSRKVNPWDNDGIIMKEYKKDWGIYLLPNI